MGRKNVRVNKLPTTRPPRKNPTATKTNAFLLYRSPIDSISYYTAIPCGCLSTDTLSMTFLTALSIVVASLNVTHIPVSENSAVITVEDPTFRFFE